MQVNLDDTPAAGVLPEGEYVARVADASDQQSKAGNDMLVVDLVVANGDWKGAEVRDWIVPNNSLGASKMKAFLSAVGFPIPSGDFQLNPSVTIGKRVEIIVRHEPYNGEQQARVKSYQAAVGSDVPAEEDPLVATAAASNGAAERDEDIPFLWRPLVSGRPETSHNPFA